MPQHEKSWPTHSGNSLGTRLGRVRELGITWAMQLGEWDG